MMDERAEHLLFRLLWLDRECGTWPVAQAAVARITSCPSLIAFTCHE